MPLVTKQKYIIRDNIMYYIFLLHIRYNIMNVSL
jgi:hypothetical protein